MAIASREAGTDPDISDAVWRVAKPGNLFEEFNELSKPELRRIVEEAERKLAAKIEMFQQTRGLICKCLDAVRNTSNCKNPPPHTNEYRRIDRLRDIITIGKAFLPRENDPRK